MESVLPFELLAKCAVLAFFAILFLQSSLDKIYNRKENGIYLTAVFEKSPLKNSVTVLLPLISLLEFLAGFSSLLGALLIWIGILWVGQLAILFSALALLCLFFGQRIAKDYAGAASLAAYFAVALVGFILLL